MAAPFAALAALGCGAGTTGGPPTAASVLTSCLQKQARPSTVSPIPPLSPGAGAGLPNASPAIGFETGGPTQTDGVIAEGPLNVERLYVFPDATTARRAAARAGPAVARQAASDARRAHAEGNPTAAAPITSVASIGRAVLVYIAGTTFGSGQPIGPAELATTRACLGKAGLL